MPRLRVGLHLVLVEGKAGAAGAARCPIWSMPRGHFRTDMARAGAAMFFLPQRARQLAAEIEAQFAAFARHGPGARSRQCPQAFSSASHHRLADPACRQALRRMRAGARVPLEPQRLLAPHRAAQGSGVVALTAPFARCCRDAAFARAGIAAPDQVFGLAWSGAMTPAASDGPARASARGPHARSILHPATGPYPGSAPGYQYADGTRGADRRRALASLLVAMRHETRRLCGLFCAIIQVL